MLRSHHLAYKLCIRRKLSVNRYAGGRALVYGILAGVAVVGVVGRGPDGDEQVFTPHCVALEILRIDVLLFLEFVTEVWKLCSIGSFVYSLRGSL
jgi:hypothetical protein